MRPTLLILFLLTFTICTTLPTSVTAAERPRIAIIIDDLGDNLKNGKRVVNLPGGVTCSFLPYSPHTKSLARYAHFRGKEVMLHLPMDSLDDRPLGRGGLKVGMLRTQFLATLRADLKAVPFISGVNNHMGSLLTQLPENMEWLMSELRSHPLYFVDSRTSTSTVARNYATAWGIPNQKRDIFLDNRRSRQSIVSQLSRLMAMARVKGFALAIGHPYDMTIDVLSEFLPRLDKAGFDLVPASGLLDGDGVRKLPEIDMALVGTEVQSEPVDQMARQ